MRASSASCHRLRALVQQNPTHLLVTSVVLTWLIFCSLQTLHSAIAVSTANELEVGDLGESLNACLTRCRLAAVHRGSYSPLCSSAIGGRGVEAGLARQELTDVASWSKRSRNSSLMSRPSRLRPLSIASLLAQVLGAHEYESNDEHTNKFNFTLAQVLNTPTIASSMSNAHRHKSLFCQLCSKQFSHERVYSAHCSSQGHIDRQRRALLRTSIRPSPARVHLSQRFGGISKRRTLKPPAAAVPADVPSPDQTPELPESEDSLAAEPLQDRQKLPSGAAA